VPSRNTCIHCRRLNVGCCGPNRRKPAFVQMSAVGDRPEISTRMTLMRHTPAQGRAVVACLRRGGTR
jgi:hypothetical protein